jgi:hypothetical protein
MSGRKHPTPTPALIVDPIADIDYQFKPDVTAQELFRSADVVCPEVDEFFLYEQSETGLGAPAILALAKLVYLYKMNGLIMASKTLGYLR